MRSDCHSFRAALRVAVVAAFCVGAIEAPATEFVIDSSGAPELADWANGELKENVGKIIQLYAETFPSKGWSPPANNL